MVGGIFYLQIDVLGWIDLIIGIEIQYGEVFVFVGYIMFFQVVVILCVVLQFEFQGVGGMEINIYVVDVVWYGSYFIVFQ